MKTLEIIGFKRANLGKTESKKIREEGNVPCVLYGGKEQVHFHTPAFLFKDLVYTGEVNKVLLTVGGKQYTCVLQDIQFHPVNEMIVHADFLELQENKPVKIDVPLKFVGTAPGVMQGGKLIQKLNKVTIKALPADLPDYMEVDISNLALGKSVRISDITPGKVTILNSPSLPIASVGIPRSLKVEEGEGAAAGKTEAKGGAKK